MSIEKVLPITVTIDDPLFKGPEIGKITKDQLSFEMSINLTQMGIDAMNTEVDDFILAEIADIIAEHMDPLLQQRFHLPNVYTFLNYTNIETDYFGVHTLH